MAGDTSPALAPPAGLTPDFDNPYSLARIAVPVFSICLAITISSTFLRFFAQWRLFHRLTWADFCIVIALGAQISFLSVLLAALPMGLGRHQWNVPAATLPSIQYLLYVSYILYDPAIAFAKLSILLQFLGIFASTYRNRFWWTIVVMTAVNFLFYIPETVAIIFSCSPREKIWDPAAVPGGGCIDQKALLTASGPFNVASDLAIFLLPIYAIWHLRLPLRRRLEVSAGFAVGLFGCVCSAVRIAYTVQLDRTGDGTFTITQNQMWANAEITVGILIANSIIVPRFFRHLMGRGSRSDDWSRRRRAHPRTGVPHAKGSAGSSVTMGLAGGTTAAAATTNTYTNSPRTLVDELDTDSPFPTGTQYGRLARQKSEELVTMDRDRDRIAPWTADSAMNWPLQRI